MKKLIAACFFFFAFVAGAHAQDYKMAAEESAKLDAIKMAEVLNLPATQQMDFQRLFQMKYEVMNDPQMSAERKKEMTRVVDLKIRASLTAEQIEKLDKNPDLLAKLTGSGTAEKSAVTNEKKKK